MSVPDRHAVRVRRSPKIGVFLTLGVLIGVVVAVLIALLTPADGQYPTSQVLGFMVLICAPVGAALGGLLAVALDGIATRRARVLEAERVEEGAPPADD
jgi:NhaP-type Na+/H+ or K+/H+ antiporter